MIQDKIKIRLGGAKSRIGNANRDNGIGEGKRDIIRTFAIGERTPQKETPTSTSFTANEGKADVIGTLYDTDHCAHFAMGYMSRDLRGKKRFTERGADVKVIGVVMSRLFTVLNFIRN